MLFGLKMNRIIILITIIKVTVALTTPEPDTQNITQCGDLLCSHNAKCRDDGNGKQACQCHTGYTGLTCHDDFNECDFGNPCWHRGICHNTIGSYSCSCLEGWLDVHCVIKDNTTDVHECEPGYMGDMCMDRCLTDNMCGQNEVCKFRGRGLLCTCAPGWHGVNCTEDVDECPKHPCPNTATCVNTQGSYNCPCLSGWEGNRCATDIDECQNSPCLNSGTCVNTNGSYRCACSRGWNGYNCSDDVDECQTNPCLNGGSCQNTKGSFKCQCTDGWYGETCQYQDTCFYSPCQNNASACTNIRDTYKCACASGWKGDNCTVDIDECINKSPCQNEATCTNEPGSFSCLCASGWQGETCEIDIDECQTEPCNSTLTCRNTLGSFSCEPKTADDGPSAGVIAGSVVGSVAVIGSVTTGVLLTKYKLLGRNSVSSGNQTEVQPENAVEKGSGENKPEIEKETRSKRIRDFLSQKRNIVKNLFVRK